MPVIRSGFWVVVALCFAGPLVSAGWLVSARPGAIVEAMTDAYRLRLLGATVGYNACVAGLSVALAIPAAVTLGRSGRGTGALWLVLPVSLLLPTIAFEYGWKQALRLASILPAAQSPGDVARCIWTLACWLWPIPAVIGALSLRRVEASVFDQSALDGAIGRITLRMLTAPMLGAAAIVFVLASQEYAVFEPTGIRVVATEVRLIFETGAAIGGDVAIATDQASRVGAAVAASTPLTAVTMLMAAGALLAARRQAGGEPIGTGVATRIARAPVTAAIASYGIVALTTAVPIVAMVASLSRPPDLAEMFRTFRPQVEGSLALAAGTMALAGLMMLGAVVARSKWALPLAVATFLIGGQMLAIVMIWQFNRPVSAWVYDSPAVAVLTYAARFGWIALAAGAVTWSRPWRELRDLAMTDGATPIRTAMSVILPLAWPMLVGAALLVGVLSLGEVPATMLVAPLRPQPLVPMLMTWIHLQQHDPMIEGTLLLCAVVLVPAGAVTVLAWLATSRRLRPRFAAALLAPLLLIGCGDPEKPRAVWLETGMGEGQVVYPRAIDYRPADDSFVIIDRMARVQRVDSSGRFINAWRMPDYAMGKPVGVSIGPDGNIYVPDTHYHRVVVYAPDGREIRRWGRLGRGPGEFIFPTDVAFDSRGRVFVSEYGDHDRIQVFDAQGSYLYEFGRFGHGDGEFSRPQSMAIVGDVVYVADSCNHRIAVFSIDGKWLRSLGGVGTEPGQFRFPYGLAVDRSGKLVVCEFGNNRVQRIDPQTGASLGTWGRAGRAPGELAYPWAVALDARDRVAIIDAGNNRVQVAQF